MMVVMVGRVALLLALLRFPRGDDGLRAGGGAAAFVAPPSGHRSWTKTGRAAAAAAAAARSSPGRSEGEDGRPRSRPPPKRGSKKTKSSRRILEAPSKEEKAMEKRISALEARNWGRMGRKTKSGGTSPSSATASRAPEGRGRQQRQKRGGQERRNGPQSGDMDEDAYEVGLDDDDGGLGAAWDLSSSEKVRALGSSELGCSHFDACAGCQYDGDLAKVPKAMDAKSFCENLMRQSRGGAQPSRSAIGASSPQDIAHFRVHMGSPHSWRTHAKLAVAPASKWGGVKVGLYAAGTHDVVPIPDCRVHHPSVNEVAHVLMSATAKVRTTAYDQVTDEGMLRYVQTSVERRTGKVQLTLVWNAEDYKEATPNLQLLVKELLRTAPELFHSVWANFRTGPGNAIFSRQPTSWHRCSGSEFVTEKVGSRGNIFYFGPQLFRQGNLDQFEKVVNAVAALVPEGSDVCELYAGIGVLGVNALGRARSVRCSDINAFNPRAFSRVVGKLDPADRGRVSYAPLSAEDAVLDGQAIGASCLIVDPPRKGLDPDVLNSLKDPDDPMTASISRIIYVSCGLDGFKRDAVQLTAAGWSLKQAEGYVLFPGSDHIETLAVFER